MNHKNLINANERRTETACARTVPAAQDAYRILLRIKPEPWEPEPQRKYLEALQVRAENPTLTLRELADKIGISKDTYSARLRQAFKYVEKHDPLPGFVDLGFIDETGLQ